MATKFERKEVLPKFKQKNFKLFTISEWSSVFSNLVSKIESVNGCLF